MAGIIVQQGLPKDTHSIYEVRLEGQEPIKTIVTHTPSCVDEWIAETEDIHPLIVELDIEWLPNNKHNKNPVATLQLCVGPHCLIFQFLHSFEKPQSQPNFLKNENYTFLGVGIDNDVKKLREDWNLTLAKTVGLRHLVTYVHEGMDFNQAGLKKSASFVLGIEVDKPKDVMLSKWDTKNLTLAQIKYGCMDSFLSFEIGRKSFVESLLTEQKFLAFVKNHLSQCVLEKQRKNVCELTCELCKIKCNGDAPFKSHLEGKKHAKNKRKAVNY